MSIVSAHQEILSKYLSLRSPLPQEQDVEYQRLRAAVEALQERISRIKEVLLQHPLFKTPVPPAPDHHPIANDIAILGIEYSIKENPERELSAEELQTLASMVRADAESFVRAIQRVEACIQRLDIFTSQPSPSLGASANSLQPLSPSFLLSPSLRRPPSLSSLATPVLDPRSPPSTTSLSFSIGTPTVFAGGKVIQEGRPAPQLREKAAAAPAPKASCCPSSGCCVVS